MINRINNDKNREFYEKYKYIFHGIKCQEDCSIIMDKLNLSNFEKKLIISIMDGNILRKCFSLSEMKNIIKEIYDIKYREDAFIMLTNLMDKTQDLAQIKTFTRIANLKKTKPLQLNNEIKINLNLETKKCPHCDHKNSFPKNINYVICGFGENGFDWYGCGKDWCFKCGKILCKSWENDQLYIEENRFHNFKCCKEHSIMNKNNYSEDYCKCNNDYVNRNVM